MRPFLLLCSGLLILALLELPIGYYTLLRIVVTIAATIIVINEIKNQIDLSVILFGLIALLFNPIIPIHLNDKEIWILIDIIVAIIFIIKAFNSNSMKSN